MARFCSECGQPKEDAEALFCTNCGHRFGAAATPQIVAAPEPAVVPASPAAPAKPLPRISKRALALTGGALALVTAIGSGAAWYLRPPAATPEAYTAAINSYLASHREQTQDKVCLANFPYGTNPVVTNAADGQTNHWLGLLVKAGLYGQPESLLDGFWPKLRYQQTAKGQAAVKNGRLCLAQGLKVAGIDDIEPPETRDDLVVGRAVFHTELDGKADWVSDEIRQQLPGEGQAGGQTLYLVVKDRQWQVLDASQQQQLGRRLQDMAQSQGGGGLLDWVKHLTGSAEPDEDEIWAALDKRMPGLSREALHFAKHKCWSSGGDDFQCTIQLGPREERVAMLKRGEGWQLRPE
ncbi:zinc ribbon domain-containing protein [uncultured Aquitalea sp.]|uniref:zinc ribbon domain-containing protein n=1 Tax=uncultured Aquitalea sp. TaxID=540272 RepID=UPI0025EE625B|nr:zinc ribbon domain-containing protein [uncultured Aquitalea sp.]